MDTTNTTTANLAVINATDKMLQVTYVLAAQVKNPLKANEVNLPNLYALKIDTPIPTFADSGASDHCFVRWEDFAEYTQLTQPRKGKAATQDGVFCIIGQGTVKKQIQTNQGISELVFCNTLHTPDLAANLISVGRFNKEGFSIMFAKGKVVFCDPDEKEVLTGLWWHRPLTDQSTWMGGIDVLPIDTNAPLHTRPSTNAANRKDDPEIDAQSTATTMPPMVTTPEADTQQPPTQPSPIQATPLQRSDQIREKTSRTTSTNLAHDNYAFLALLDDAYDPDNDFFVPRMFDKAMRRPDLWQPAMDEELWVMNERGVFQVIDSKNVLERKKIISCQWVYAVKYNAEGNIVRRKTRLVAKGYSQIVGEDYKETYMAVVRLESICISAAVAAQMDWHIWQVDFVSTYLNSVLDF
ncbi:hypothetical protein E4T56_gene1712 [Termitomyces sp. T112]|nr:hypothetical protein E4T56_gene1712 [Termitomyces sp. T112]